MYDFLKKVPLFANLSEDDLERLCQMVEEVRLPAGQELFAEGSTGKQAYVIKEGQLNIFKASSDRKILLAVRGPGEVIGEMSLLEAAPRMASVQAKTDCLLLAIRQEQLDQLLHISPSAAHAMLQTVLARWRSSEAMLRQSEKMAQLGTLTAGITHELNNPAAAVRRSTAQLQSALQQLEHRQVQLGQLALTPAQETLLDELAQQTQQQALYPSMLAALARSDREYALEIWLEDRGIKNAWELAPALVNLDYDTDGVAALASRFTVEQLPIVIGWLDAAYAVYSLLAEISQGAERITEIAKALKSYSYLEQASLQTVDLHQGLDNTLIMLRSKLSGITVRRDYAADLPKIQAYSSELNQVWTNIIDNAVDALQGKGDIVIGTRQDGEWVVVEIEDNGPGIAPEIRPKVFDPFFTTKPPGQGMGLGLNITYNIVVQRHRGDIKVFSQPGQTCFQVSLPITFEANEDAPPTLAGMARASDEQLRHILATCRTIAVVGVSARQDRPAHTVPAYLQAQGYRLFPVNPNLDEVLGEKAYPDLSSIPEPVDVVLIFRRSEMIPPLMAEAIHIGAKVVWMQEGIVNEDAAQVGRAAGLQVIMDTCMRATHKRLEATAQPG